MKSYQFACHSHVHKSSIRGRNLQNSFNTITEIIIVIIIIITETFILLLLHDNCTISTTYSYIFDDYMHIHIF